MSDADLIPPSNAPTSAPNLENPVPIQKTGLADDENALDQSQNALVQSQNALVQSQNALVQSQNALVQSQNALVQSQNALDQTQNALEQNQNAVVQTQNGSDDDETVGEVERVSKLIARAGIASRRAAEDMIGAGRVTVNGHTISEPGFKADPYNDRILVDGHPLRVSEKPGVVIIFHKPRLVMTTKDDPGGRPTVMDYLPRKWQLLHPVGRLDFDTSGILLLTDDGELTHLLTHPSHGAEKVYEARVRGVVEPVAIEKLERGIRLDDGPTSPCRAKLMAQRDKNALVQLVLREGRNRQVRRMLEAVGHPVNSLRRIAFAGIELEGLPAGEFRVLLPGEVKALRKRVESKVKKLSAPKGKFHKQKIKKPDDAEKVGSEAAPEERKSRGGPRSVKISNPIAKNTLRTPKPATGTKKIANRPRNAPNVPEKAPLERKGSKARPYTSKGEGKASAPRSTAPRPTAPRTPRPPREEAPDRAPVSKRIEKRWKS